MSTLELRRVPKACEQPTQRAEAAFMRAHRTANEPTLTAHTRQAVSSANRATRGDRFA
jgi:hypothetical protein